jgi:DNA-binding NarL/FixJ family response regulator
MTHKRKIIKLYLSGLLTKEISEKTNHHPYNVDNYISSFEQVRSLYEEGKNIQQISFFTKLSQKLVEEYIEIIKEVKQLQKKN